MEHIVGLNELLDRKRRDRSVCPQYVEDIMLEEIYIGREQK